MSVFTIWGVTTGPEYDLPTFYATEARARLAIRKEVGGLTGTWVERFNGKQIEFHEVTPKRKLPSRTWVWCIHSDEVIS